MNNAIQTVLQDKSILNSSLYLSATVIGILSSWAWKWATGQVQCFFDMLRTFKARTATSFSTQLAVVITFISSGALDNVSFAVAISLGLLAGGAIDAAIIKGKTKIWSKREREKGERADITVIKKKLGVKK